MKSNMPLSEYCVEFILTYDDGMAFHRHVFHKLAIVGQRFWSSDRINSLGRKRLKDSKRTLSVLCVGNHVNGYC